MKNVFDWKAINNERGSQVERKNKEMKSLMYFELLLYSGPIIVCFMSAVTYIRCRKCRERNEKLCFHFAYKFCLCSSFFLFFPHDITEERVWKFTYKRQTDSRGYSNNTIKNILRRARRQHINEEWNVARALRDSANLVDSMILFLKMSSFTVTGNEIISICVTIILKVLQPPPFGEWQLERDWRLLPWSWRV